MAVQLVVGRDARHGSGVIASPVDPVTFIAARIVERYRHPSRTAWLYLFQLTLDADFQPLPPRRDQIVQAWVDEGAGLMPIDADQAIALCQATVDRRHDESPAVPSTRDDRRRQMARQVSFSISPPADPVDSDDGSLALVDLFSRAIAFTPKSDRRVIETWRPFEGGWFSAYKPPQA